MNTVALRHWFAQPQILWLYLVLPFLTVVAFVAGRRRRRLLAQLGRLPALAALTARRRPWRRLRGLCWFFGIMALLIGSAGPQWGREAEPTAAPGRDLVVLFDMSRSMLADDATPSRQERGKQGVRGLIAALKKRGGNRVALVAFASKADVICPLTHDYDHFLEKLDELDAGQLPLPLRPDENSFSGTRIGAGLTAALNAHDPRFKGAQDILLISDGDDPTGGRVKGLQDADKEWKEPLDVLSHEHMPVYTVGIGDKDKGGKIPYREGYLTVAGEPVETRLNEGPLRTIAEKTRATYTAAGTETPRLAELFRNTIDQGDKREVLDDALRLYRQRYPWFFGAALFFLSAEMMLGRTAKKKVSKPASGPRSAPRGTAPPPRKALESVS